MKKMMNSSNLKKLLLGVLAFSMANQAGAVVLENSTTGFVDNASITRDIVFTAGDFEGVSETISSICVSVSFAKSNDGSFVADNVAPSAGTPYHNEIELVLTSPGSTNVTLISNDSDVEINADPVESFNSGSVPFQGTIVFDQSAADPVNVDPDLPQEGTFRPHPGDLADFLSENAVGTWTLFIEDDVGADGLSFYSYAVSINEEQCETPGFAPSVPVPATSNWAALLLIALFALSAVFYRRRRTANYIV